MTPQIQLLSQVNSPYDLWSPRSLIYCKRLKCSAFFKNLGHNQPVADADVGAAPEGLLRAAADPRLRGVGARLRPEVDILQTLKIN